MKIAITFRGRDYTTRPFGLLSISPLLNFSAAPKSQVVAIRGQSITVQSVTPDQASRLSDLFGDGSEASILGVFQSESSLEEIIYLLTQVTNLPEDWIGYLGQGDWYTDLDPSELALLLQTLMLPFQSIAETLGDSSAVRTLQRLIPGLPGDLTIGEVTDLVGLLAESVDEDKSPPLIPPAPAAPASPNPTMHTTSRIKSGLPMVVLSQKPLNAVTVAHLSAPVDEEELLG